MPAAAAVVAAALLLLAACSAGPGPDHYSAVLDGLGVPTAWELVHTTVFSLTGGDHAVEPSRSQDDIGCFEAPCPRLTRYYVVDGPGSDILAAARGLLSDAGFTIGHSAAPACDIPPGSSFACGVEATRGNDHVEVTIYRPGGTTAGIGSSDPSKVLVTIEARSYQ